MTSISPGQSNDGVVEHVERETPSEVPLEIGLEEIVSAFEEAPSVVQLDASQLWEVVILILGAKSVVDGGCDEDGSRAKGTGDELVVLTGDGGQGGKVEDGHEMSREKRVLGFKSSRMGWMYTPGIARRCRGSTGRRQLYCCLRSGANSCDIDHTTSRKELHPPMAP